VAYCKFWLGLIQSPEAAKKCYLSAHRILKKHGVLIGQLKFKMLTGYLLWQDGYVVAFVCVDVQTLEILFR